MDDLSRSISPLLAFVAAVETGGGSSAALRLGITPSAVSRNITKLERELGAKLFRRSTRAVEVTDEALRLYEKAAPLLNGLANAIGDTGNKGPKGALRVSMSGELLRILMGGLARRFLPAHPGLRLDLGSQDSHVNLIREGYDLALRIGEPAPSELTARRIADLPLVLVASPSFLEAVGRPNDIDDLRRLQFVCYRRHSVLPEVAFSDGTALQPAGPMVLDSGHAMREAALAGGGVAQLVRAFVSEDIATGRLEALLSPASLPSLPLVALHAYGRLPTKRLVAFTDFLQSEIAKFGEKPGEG